MAQMNLHIMDMINRGIRCFGWFGICFICGGFISSL